MISINSLIEQVKNQFSKSMVESQSASGVLGVDIGSYSVKMVKLEQNKEGRKVAGFGIEKIVDKNYHDALSKALIKVKASPGQVSVVAVSGQGVVSRYIELPHMNKQELDSSMKFEIEKYVPFPLGEVACDYSVVHEMKDKAKMSVLIAAAKNDLIQKKIALAKEVNLGLKTIDLDCLALANFFLEVASSREKGLGVGLINIGKTISSIDIIVDGVPYLSRDIFIGGDDVTRKISEALEIDYPEAEKMKIEPQGKEGDLARIWEPVLHDLAAEIRVSLDYFEARNNKAIEKILVTGGASRLSGLQEYLHHVLSIDVSRWNYSDYLVFDSAVDRDDFKKNSDLLAIALGLALR